MLKTNIAKKNGSSNIQRTDIRLKRRWLIVWQSSEAVEIRNESFVMNRESEWEILPYQQRASGWCSALVCFVFLLFSNIYIYIFRVSHSGFCQWDCCCCCDCLSYSCCVELLSRMRLWWAHKAIAKGKNITIFQFSFVCISTRWRRSV